MKCARCDAKENRIDGYCSIECRNYADYEEEIIKLKNIIKSLKENIIKSMECDGCKHYLKAKDEYPCESCCRDMNDHYEAKEKKCSIPNNTECHSYNNGKCMSDFCDKVMKD